MARVEAATGADFPLLEELTPHEVVLESFEVQPGGIVQGKEFGPSIKLVWQYGPDASDTVWDYTGFKKPATEQYPHGQAILGQGSAGYSKLRRLLNAAAGRPESAEITWIDDETFEYGDNAGFTSRLTPGTTRLRIVGEHVPKKDGNGHMFKVKTYRPAAATKAAAPAGAHAGGEAPAVFPPVRQLPPRPESSDDASTDNIGW